MSDPTYRIEREHTPGEAYSWYVRVYRLADDGYPVYTHHGNDGESVLGAAQDWIAEQSVKKPTLVLYVGDDGRPVEAHSVKAGQYIEDTPPRGEDAIGV